MVLRALRQPDNGGVLIQGIGGVGKSTLAAQVLHRLATDDHFVLISIKGVTDPERVLETIGKRLLALCLEHRLDERHPLRQLSVAAREPSQPWRDRFELVASIWLAHMPVAFLFDNFEDNLLDGAMADTELAALLARWLQSPGLSRLAFTCRYPVLLPDDAHSRLHTLHLGPLSWAETRKLFWRLEGLNALSLDEQRRAYEQVGGHPRSLEYLDAILRGGKGRFNDITIRLKQQLQAKGITDPTRWCADTAGGLDAAMAETVTLIADDVLLDRLLAELDDDPLARRLLIGAAVYRQPVDDLGLFWSVGTPVERIEDPARMARIQAIRDRLREARKANPAASMSDVLSEREREEFVRDYADEYPSPVGPPAGFVAARQRLMDLSLLATIRLVDSGDEEFLVHRWTAAALTARVPEEEWAVSHRAAAGYWRWRVDRRAQDPKQDIADSLEAQHHLRLLGDLDDAHATIRVVCTQLQRWGAWAWEERLLHECLAWVPAGSEQAAITLHLLGIVAEERGDYDTALDWFRQALTVSEQRGDRAGIATGYHQLGMIAQERGNYDEARHLYERSLVISEEVNSRSCMAASYHQLGAIASIRGDLDAASTRHRQALDILKELGDRSGIASTFHELGIIAQGKGDYSAADELYRLALAAMEQLGNRTGIASSYHQLSRIADLRGEHGAALDWCRKSLAISEELGNRSGMAVSYHQLGSYAYRRGEYETALGWYQRSLVLREQLGDRIGTAASQGQLGACYTQMKQATVAIPFTLRSLVIHLNLLSPDVVVNLYWLSGQRDMLGSDAFQAILAEHVESDAIPDLLTMVDKYERAQAPTPDPPT